jgi:hypothetical protein
MTNRELAAHLFLSENTIKTQLRGLFSKLDVRNRVQAVAVARTGILGEQRPRRIHADGEQGSPHVNGNPSSNGKPAGRR